MPIPQIVRLSASWKIRRNSAFLRIIETIALVSLALVLTSLLWLVADRPVSSPLFLVAIIATAWLCGFKYGIIAAVLSSFALDYFFIRPRFEFSGTQEEIVRLLIFMSEGVILSWAIEKLRAASFELDTKNHQLRALTDHQQQLREEEQKRIAREIHDELGQALTVLKMNIHMLRKQSEAASTPDHISNGLGELLEMTDTTISTVRRIASELRPSLLDDFGLLSAIEWQVREFGRRTGIATELHSNVEKVDLGAERNNAVYRIVQEALTNVARHAEATRVLIEVIVDESEFSVHIRDNGRGIESSVKKKPSFGLIGMQERALMIGGELLIESEPGTGTVVHLQLPVSVDALHSSDRGTE